MDDFTEVKLEIFVPQDYTAKVREELARIGVGKVGRYDHCVAVYAIQGYFRPLPGADPFEGEIGRISESVEDKIEVNCKRELVKEALKAIRNVHPYEEPVVNVIPLANHLLEMRSMTGQ